MRKLNDPILNDLALHVEVCRELPDARQHALMRALERLDDELTTARAVTAEPDAPASPPRRSHHKKPEAAR